MNHHEVQEIAKDTIALVRDTVKPGMSVADTARAAEDYMHGRGITSFWWDNVGAYAFAGDDTTLSEEALGYVPSARKLAADDILTMDLSPSDGDIWGDYARTIILEHGRVVQNAEDIENPEWRDGLLTEEALHRKLTETARPDMTFEELYKVMDAEVRSLGYENLDFLGNFGHSITTRDPDRIFIEKGNISKLSSVKYFTFEPHISLPGGLYGYKMENIYYFSDGRVREL